MSVFFYAISIIIFNKEMNELNLMADLNTKYLDYTGLGIFLSKLKEYIEKRISEINGENLNLNASGADNPTIASQIEDLWAVIGSTDGFGGSIIENIEKILDEYVKSISTPTLQSQPLKLVITEGTGDNEDRFTIELQDNGLNNTLSTLTNARVSKITPANDGGAVTLAVDNNTGDVKLTVNSKAFTERIETLESDRIKSITKGISTENYLTLGVLTTDLNTTITIDDTSLKEKIDEIDTEMDTFVKSESIPTKLPNPELLTVKWKDTSNNDQTITYDGSVASIVDLTDGVYYAATSNNANIATLATKSTNIAGGETGSIPYQSAVNTTAMLGIGSEGQVLKVSSDGLPVWSSDDNTDTKNTAGSTNSASKLFLIGAISQDVNPQTYSNSKIHATDGVLTATKFDGPIKGTSITDVNLGYSDLDFKFYNHISGCTATEETGNKRYAGTANSYGFPVSNNANSMLWMGAHSGDYGHQLGFSSNGNIYMRYVSGGLFPEIANGGSWKALVTTTESDPIFVAATTSEIQALFS